VQKVTDEILHARYLTGKADCLGQVAALAVNLVINTCAVIIRSGDWHQSHHQCRNCVSG
jgi:hypothetical protein